MKKIGKEDEYIDLIQWIIVRPFTFERFLKASWDNQPVIFVNSEKKTN